MQNEHSLILCAKQVAYMRKIKNLKMEDSVINWKLSCNLLPICSTNYYSKGVIILEDIGKDLSFFSLVLQQLWENTLKSLCQDVPSFRKLFQKAV